MAPRCWAVETFRWNVSNHGDGPPGRRSNHRADSVRAIHESPLPLLQLFHDFVQNVLGRTDP